MEKRDNIYMRLKGIPYAATVEDVQTFFRSALEVAAEDIHIRIGIHGRNSGEAFVIFHSHAEVTKAMSKNFRNMGHRYVELVPSSLEELNKAKKTARLSAVGKGQGIVRVHRLPYHTTVKDIRTFFDGLQIVENGVYIIYARDGVTITDAYVEFASEAEAKSALDRNREWNNGTRYVEVFQSSKGELLHVLNYEVAGKFAALARHFGVDTAVSGRPTPTFVRPADLRIFYDQIRMCAQSREGFSAAGDEFAPNSLIRMTGLPAASTERTIRQWIETVGPQRDVTSPRHVFVNFEGGGREAFCLFRRREEAVAALTLDGSGVGTSHVAVRPCSFKTLLKSLGEGNTAMMDAALPDLFYKAKDDFWELVAPVPPRAMSAAPPQGTPAVPCISMSQLDLVSSLGALHHLEKAGGSLDAPTTSSASSKKPSKWSRSLRTETYGESSESTKRKRDPASELTGTVLHLRGLPYKATRDHVVEFFKNYDIVESSIRFGTDRDGRTTGECWVTCKSASVARQAVAERNRKYICDRYVEVFIE